MNFCHTNEEIDEIGEGLIRKYDFEAFAAGQATDIEGFIMKQLKHQIVYDNFAEEDAGKLAFLGDGIAELTVWREGKRVKVVPPPKMIVLDNHLRQEIMQAPRRFKLAHEAGHIIMDMLCNRPVTASYNVEYDVERTYTIQDLESIFSMREHQATAMGVALLMPKTLVIGLLNHLSSQKRIPIYGNSVLMNDDRILIRSMADHFLVSY